jgi:hypothetical protein
MVQEALDDAGVGYEVVPGPWPFRMNRHAVKTNTGQAAFPAIEFEDGTWYRDQARAMAAAIRERRLDQMHGVTPLR